MLKNPTALSPLKEKAKSSLNAVKTGLTGQTVLLPTDDAAAYQNHILRHIARHTLVGEEEDTLVQFIADTEWRLLRIAPLEAAIYAIGRLEDPDLYPEEQDRVTREALIRGKIFMLYRRELSNIALEERRRRNHLKTDLEKLIALQKERHDQQTPAADVQTKMRSAVRSFHMTRELKESFNPRKFGFEFSLDEVEFCYDATMHAAELHEPTEPCYATLLG